ncbi:hypothetical protein Q7689_34190, partial [Nocardiopsis tropica]|nr:hypothetical protein [Nocardiopsis tropica]
MLSIDHFSCDLCDRPSGDDARVCTRCADDAAAALRQVAEWLAEDLVTATAKQTALGTGRSGGKPTKASEAPLPLDLRASEAATVLRSTLSTWVRLVHADGSKQALPADTLAAMAAWLARRRPRPFPDRGLLTSSESFRHPAPHYPSLVKSAQVGPPRVPTAASPSPPRAPCS